MNILLPGQYPRSEALVAASRDLDRKRITPAEFEDVLIKDIASFKSLQSNFPYASTGQFEWQDLVRPFADLLGAEVGTLKRFYETNTFWKTLEFTQTPIIANTTLDMWIQNYFFGKNLYKSDDHLVFTLPFIFLFKEFSQGISIDQIAEVIFIAGQKLASYPNKVICFVEPSFGWTSLSKEEKKVAEDLLKKIRKETKTPLYIYTCFFPVERQLDYLYSLPVDGIGIDFYANSLQHILKAFPKDKTLLAGIINTQSTLIDPKNGLEIFLEHALKHINKDKIFITPNAPAELLPRIIMDKKIKHVQEVCR